VSNQALSSVQRWWKSSLGYFKRKVCNVLGSPWGWQWGERLYLQVVFNYHQLPVFKLQNYLMKSLWRLMTHNNGSREFMVNLKKVITMLTVKLYRAHLWSRGSSEILYSI